MRPIYLYQIFFVVLLCFSCKSRELRTPQFIVVADSAINHGRYDLASSILEMYSSGDGIIDKDFEMYRSLQKLKIKFLNDSISIEDYESIDSIEKIYYETNDYSNVCWALLCKSDIYKKAANYSEALNTLLKAKDLTERNEVPSILGGIIQECIGDVYFAQNMYDDCIEYYSNFYSIASLCKDSLRLAHASLKMARVYTIENNVDSTVFCLKQASILAVNYPQYQRIRRIAIRRLCNIYIQIEEYDKALEIMSRDSLDTTNWAYWHYGQGHLDSASFYFEKFLSNPSFSIQAEGLRKLIEIANRTNDEHRLALYSSELVEVNDSIKKNSQREKMRQAEMQHAIDNIVSANERHTTSIALVITGILAFLIVNTITLVKYRRENRKLAQKGVASKKEPVLAEGRHISIEELHESALYRYIKLNAGKDDFRLTSEQWHELRVLIDAAYDGFIGKLLEMGAVSETELNVCYLIKLGVPPAFIAKLLCKSKSGITMLRSRLYKKFTGTDGTPQDFDDLIMAL